MCRVGFVETVRAVGLAAGERVVDRFRNEWAAFTVIEVDQALAEHASALATESGLRSLDALHLAAALLLGGERTTVVTWDRRLHGAASDRGLRMIPATLG